MTKTMAAARCLYHVPATEGLAPKWTLPAEYAAAAYRAACSGGRPPPGSGRAVRAFLERHGRGFQSAPDFHAFLRIHRVEIL
ncbi:MAG: hypothetical protein LBP69_09620 [Treponema sp.]|nr:hypothetical protein [Treponema sp.]